MRARILGLLDSPWSVAASSALTLSLGLFFTFVWAPHPWGWQGIDRYHDLAVALAQGEPFGTTDVPWGYAYYVAAWYAVFGEHTWLPVLGQVVINAAVPPLLYALVGPAVGRRAATLAALLVGAFSFNTIYASTQASDAVCTVLFLASLLCFARGHLTGRTIAFAASGLLAGLVPQFRPNMVLLPLVIAAGYALLPRPSPTRCVRAALFLAVVVLALAPWSVRNYRLTGEFLPTSTHGGVQLWYGSLQIGPYLESRAHNPRSVFEWPALPYTSVSARSIEVEVSLPPCGVRNEIQLALVYWTDRDRRPQRVSARDTRGETTTFEVPGQPAPTVVYYFVEATGPDRRQTTPPEGATGPFVLFVSDDHLGDLDRHGDLLDVFDLVRLVHHLAWGEPLPDAQRLDLDRNARVDQLDLELATSALAPVTAQPHVSPVTRAFRPGDQEAVIEFSDGSRLTVPRVFSGRVTDLGVTQGLAAAMATTWRPWARLGPSHDDASLDPCLLAEGVRANEVFYRREVHQMRRYLALAWDNISREPVQFAAASVYRTGRLFVIRGTDDDQTAHQFAGSGMVYAIGQLLTAAYLLLFLSGAVVAWRRRSPLLLALVPILYVPATISVVLTNMRYTITVQPLMFAFIALALVAAFKLDAPLPPAPRSR